MELLKKIFPLSFKCTEKNELISSIIIYVVLGIAVGVTLSIVGWLLPVPGIGLLLSPVTMVTELYTTAGIVFSILVFTKVFK